MRRFPLFQFSLGWLLAGKPGIGTIPGTTQLHHLYENLGEAGVELTPDELRGLHAALLKITGQGARTPESALADQ